MDPRTGRLRPQEESGDLTALAQGARGPVGALAQQPGREWAEGGAEMARGVLGSCVPSALRLWPPHLVPLALGISSLGCAALISGPPALMGRHGRTHRAGGWISGEGVLLIPSHHNQPCSGQGTETCPLGMGVEGVVSVSGSPQQPFSAQLLPGCQLDCWIFWGVGTACSHPGVTGEQPGLACLGQVPNWLQSGCCGASRSGLTWQRRWGITA